jgi:endoglucanase
MPTRPDVPRPAAGHAPARLLTDGAALVARGDDGVRRPVRLRGLNRSGLQHKPGLAQAGFPGDPRTEFTLWREDWRARVLRLPLALDRLEPESAYLADVDALVDAAADVGLYLLLELHGLSDEPHPALPPEDQALAVWARLAARYGPRPHVLFDLWNEPHPETLLGRASPLWRRAAWEMWREFAQALIDAVRAAGAEETLIVVGGIDWAYDLSPLRAPRARLEGRGPLAYATHVYPFKERISTRVVGRPREWRRAFSRLAEELPVLVTEFGAAPGARDDPHFPGFSDDDTRAWLTEFLDYVDELGLSALAWSAGDRPHLVQATDGGAPGDLGSCTLDPRRPTSPFGTQVRAWLRDEPRPA